MTTKEFKQQLADSIWEILPFDILEINRITAHSEQITIDLKDESVYSLSLSKVEDGQVNYPVS